MTSVASPSPDTRDQPDWCEITLTSRCNQRCFFCYEDARSVAADPDIEHVKALLRDIRKRADQVVLCGKEILLRRDVLDIVAYAASLGLQVVAFTNGQALARKAMVSQLAEAGCTSITVSFHFPDPEAFARGTRTVARGFTRTLDGLRAVAAYNLEHPGRQMPLSTETDMCALNAGRLAGMRDTLREAMLGQPWNMRIASLLPTRTYDIGLQHALAPWAAARDELAAFLATHPAEIPLKFVKVPLCMLPPGHEHQSLEVEYVHRGTALTFNHAEIGSVDTDTITPSRTRDLIASLQTHPYRWVCRRCGLLPLCRFERVDWFSRFFEPTRAQKPVAPEADAAQVLERMGGGSWDHWLRTQTVPLQQHRFPEELLLDSLRDPLPGGVELADAYVHVRPVAAVDLRVQGSVVSLQLGAPERTAQSLGAMIGYLHVQPIGEPAPPEALRACLRAIASVELPALDRWTDPWFDQGTARLWAAAWRRFGEHLWPGLGTIGPWQTTGAAMSADGKLELELALGSARAVLQFELEGSSERLGICVDKAHARGLVESLREVVGNMPAELRPMPQKAIEAVAQLPADALRFVFKEGEPVEFEIVPHRPRQPCLRTVGGLDLLYSGTLTPAATRFAAVLLKVMAALQSASLAEWESAVRRVADKACIAGTAFEMK